MIDPCILMNFFRKPNISMLKVVPRFIYVLTLKGASSPFPEASVCYDLSPNYPTVQISVDINNGFKGDFIGSADEYSTLADVEKVVT